MARSPRPCRPSGGWCRAWADEHEAGALDPLGEVGVLGQEAVARVDGHGVGDLRGADDGRDVQVAVAGGGRADADRFVGEQDMLEIAIGLGVDGDGLDAEFAAGALDAQRDLAAVGDEDFSIIRSRTAVGCIPPAVRSRPGSSTHVPARSDSIWFRIFIASMMHRMSPTLTCCPSSTNALLPRRGRPVEGAHHRRAHQGALVGSGAASAGRRGSHRLRGGRGCSRGPRPHHHRPSARCRAADAHRFLALVDLDLGDVGFFEQLDELLDLADIHDWVVPALQRFGLPVGPSIRRRRRSAPARSRAGRGR
jgi:hypothetical protein